MPYRFVISDPNTRKSFQKDLEAPSLLGMKIGDSFDGTIIGLEGFKLQITGGSDKEGFPMRSDLIGPGRHEALLSGPPGFHPLSKGMRKRKLIRGNTISNDIMQLNCKIVEGQGDVGMILGIQPKEKKEESGTEKK